jgi:galactokinase
VRLDDRSSRSAQDRAAHAFEQRFKSPPTHTASAPGRINLIGEHTDYNGGLVLPTPIDLRCAAVARIGDGAQSRLFAADLEEEFRFDSSGDLARYLDNAGGVPRGHWARYILGVQDGFRQRGHRVPALDIAIASDVPMGAGLSSSAALEAATALLVESVLARPFDRHELARLCREAEHTFAGVPCGIMDQLAVLLDHPGQALLIDCVTEKATSIPLPPAEMAAILIIDTQVRHNLADGEYAKRRATCAGAAAKLGVPLLCQSTLAQLGSAGLTPEESRCSAHVLCENQRVREAVEALGRADVPALGTLMYESHDSLRTNYRVSCPELDTIVDAARMIPAVHGARMTGAGFGGCAIALVDPKGADGAVDQVFRTFQQTYGHPCRLLSADRP